MHNNAYFNGYAHSNVGYGASCEDLKNYFEEFELGKLFTDSHVEN